MIHRYKLGGMNIVLDICSGSVHLVDEVAYDMIGLFETESREAITAAMLEKYGDREDVTEADINECYEQIEELRDAGKLFTPDTFESMAGALKAKSANPAEARKGPESWTGVKREQDFKDDYLEEARTVLNNPYLQPEDMQWLPWSDGLAKVKDALMDPSSINMKVEFNIRIFRVYIWSASFFHHEIITNRIFHFQGYKL